MKIENTMNEMRRHVKQMQEKLNEMNTKIIRVRFSHFLGEFEKNEFKMVMQFSINPQEDPTSQLRPAN